MCVLLITRLLRGVGRWARKPVNHTSWVAVVTPADRPKSVRNCCLIELFCGVVCVVTLPLWHFCWYRGFCHRTGSDLLLFVSISLLLDKLVPKGICSQVLRSTVVDFSLFRWSKCPVFEIDKKKLSFLLVYYIIPFGISFFWWSQHITFQYLQLLHG